MPLPQSIACLRTTPGSPAARHALLQDIAGISQQIQDFACCIKGYNKKKLTAYQCNELRHLFPLHEGDEVFRIIIKSILARKNQAYHFNYLSPEQFACYVAKALVDKVQKKWFPDEVHSGITIEPSDNTSRPFRPEDYDCLRETFEAQLRAEWDAMNDSVPAIDRLALYVEFANEGWRNQQNITADISDATWEFMVNAADLSPDRTVPRLSRLAKAGHGDGIWNQLTELAGKPNTDSYKRRANRMKSLPVNGRNETFTQVINRVYENAVNDLNLS
jgi:hypothetical protein